jgi:hypothetical protein
MHIAVDCRVFETATALELSVLRSFMCAINPIEIQTPTIATYTRDNIKVSTNVQLSLYYLATPEYNTTKTAKKSYAF